MHIHWFNPENDLALASDLLNFTPPKSALQIHNSGAMLPLWFASPGDKVLCYGVNARWLETMQRVFDIDVDVFDHHTAADAVPEPWGWSKYAKHYFLTEGFMPESMPSDDEIRQMRSLSHRRTASMLTDRLRMLLPGIDIGIAAAEVEEMETVHTIISDGRAYYIKHPWSSSGRGVQCTADVDADRALKFADDSIRHQGSVMIEPAYDKTIDFARLYECSAGVCADIGASVFATDSHSAYAGNVLASETELMDIVSKHIGREIMTIVTETIRRIIEIEIAPYYDGVVGVDMLIDKCGTLAIAEVNLRKTMGYVAARFADKYLAPGATGTFRIGQASSFANNTTEYEMSGHHIAHGTLSLTPPGTPLSFIVEVN